MAGFDLEAFEDIDLHPSCGDVMEEFNSKNVSYVMFYLSKKEGKDGELRIRIKPDESDRGIGFNKEPYRKFIKRLPEDDCRVCLVWFHPGKGDDYKIDRATPICVTWCPDIEPESEKEAREYFGDCMALNMNKYLIREEGDYQLEVKATCLEELDPDEVEEQLDQGRPPTAISGVFKKEKKGGRP